MAQERTVNIDTDFLLNYLDVNGVAPRGRSKYSANFRTNYTFTTGWLKRAFVGGGVQWRSAPVVGVTPGNVGDPGRVMLYGKAYDTEFFNVGYSGKLDARGKSLRYRIQLNVDNVFQNRGDYIVTQVDATNVPIQYRFREPRLFSLTTTLDF